MCRNIKTLFNFDPPATDEEIRAASLQFVRKLSGFTCAVEGERGGVRSRDRRDGRGGAPADRLAVDQRDARAIARKWRRPRSCDRPSDSARVRRAEALRHTVSHTRLRHRFATLVSDAVAQGFSPALLSEKRRTTSGQNSSHALPPRRLSDAHAAAQRGLPRRWSRLGGSHAFSITVVRACCRRSAPRQAADGLVATLREHRRS